MTQTGEPGYVWLLSTGTDQGRTRQGPLVTLAALIFGALIAQVAFAGEGSEGEPWASASAVSDKKFKKLKRQVAALRQQVNTLSRQPGPQGPPGPMGAPGPQGPAGTAPVCKGNGSGDAMVAAGGVCIDKYEVSVWSSPTGGTHYGASSDNYPCSDTGQNCSNIYARSVPGVSPSRFLTWFQAQQALANVGKRLPSNAEWQQAVAGTPNPGPDNGTTDCNTSNTLNVAPTGSRSACVSRFGAFDMVGNLYEWVADWVSATTACPGWGSVGSFSSNDTMCLSGASTTVTGPGALIRGGAFLSTSAAGPFTVEGGSRPSESSTTIGFRGAR